MVTAVRRGDRAGVGGGDGVVDVPFGDKLWVLVVGLEWASILVVTILKVGDSFASTILSSAYGRSKIEGILSISIVIDF